MLSSRGQSMTGGRLAPYLDAHVTRKHDPCYVGLSVAENNQNIDLLGPRLAQVGQPPAHVMAYDDMAGKAGLRAGVAALFEREVFDRPVDPDHVRVLSGASGVLDALGHVLADPGDSVIVPTPSYSGFWPDLEIRPGLTIVPAPTCEEGGFRLTPDVLDVAWDAAPSPPAILLLTNPDNPRGQVMAAADVAAVLAWAGDREMHVVADEIYALSVFSGSSFTSVGRMQEQLGDRLHVVWAFSKDFGMSGLRCGIVISEHKDLRASMDLQGMWQGVSGHTQFVLSEMLADQDWVAEYLQTMRQRLSTSVQRVTAALRDIGVPWLEPEAGFFLLCDFRAFLKESTWQDEHRLWASILERSNVNLTPGSACRVSEPGWFRLCYAANPLDTVVAAVRRLGEHLR